MGLLTAIMSGRPLRADASPWKPWDDRWYEAVAGVGTAVGIPVTPTVALQVAAVFACVQAIAETVATLPLVTYRRLSNGGRDRATEHPLYPVLHDSPNAWQTSVEFLDDQTGHALLHGNCYAEIIPGPGGTVAELVPIHPDRVKVEQLPSRRLRYQVRQPDGTWRPFTQDEILHVRGRSADFIGGMSRSVAARDAIALARAIELYGARFFANDASIGVMLLHPQKLSKDAHARLKESWEEKFAGVGQAHKTAILEEGLKAERLPMTAAKDAQLTEAQEAAVIQVCRYFRVPPHKIQHMLRATFSNIEQQSIEWVTDTILPWTRRWESRINTTLVATPNVFAEFLLLGLLRGDSAARSAYYQQMFNIGGLNQNEIRGFENLNPIPGGDRYWVQGAMVPIDQPDRFAGGQTTGRAPTLPPADDPADPPPVPPRRRAEAVATELRARPVRAFRLLLADAADRIARAEVREVEKRLDKVNGDATRISVWLATFGDEHAQYVARTLQPLVAAWEHETDHTPAIDGLVARVRAGGFSVTDDFLTWSAGRASAIAATLRAAFDCEEPTPNPDPLPRAA